jgi:hypothetical protein
MDKLMFNVEGTPDDRMGGGRICWVDKVILKKACEITVQAFIAADQLIWETETR